MSKQYDFDKKIPVIRKKKLSESVVKETKKYDFGSVMESSPWQWMVGRAVKTMGHANAVRGAALGSAAGAAGSVATNMMKSDNDPTKKGVIGSAFSGAAKGAVLGGVGGSAAGHLARSGMGRRFQRDMMEQGKNKMLATITSNEIAKLRRQGLKGKKLDDAMKNFNPLETFNKSFRKVKDNTWSLTGLYQGHWGGNKYIDYVPIFN